jgi:MFS superfamily sulfate permease-like transporter
MAQPRRRPLSANLSAGAEKLSLLTGVTAGLAYSIFASFVANALTPVSGYLVEADSFRRSVSGRYQEVLSLNGAIPILLASLIVFVLVWWSTRVILEHWQREDWGRIGSIDRSLSDGPSLVPVIIAPLASAVSK